MPVSLSISVQGLDELHEQLDRLSPKKNSAWVARSLKKCAELTQAITTKQMIIPGGRFRGPRGPRGGKGKMTSAKAHPTKVTSRSGRLRGSIRVNLAPLPFAAEVGTDVVYAHVHEFGGSIGVRSVVVRSHTRSSAFGRKTAPFTVPSHFRSGHYADYPARPFLAPGLTKASRSFDQLFAKELAKEIR